MRIIRDEIYLGILMIPLFTKYGMTRCNVKDCHEKPSTIIAECLDDDGDLCDFALCEAHYKEAKEKGEIRFSLEFYHVKENGEEKEN